MNDDSLRAWWPDLATVVAELRRLDRAAVAERLLDVVEAGATSSEIIDPVGLVLREHDAIRSGLDGAAARAWDAVMADVHRAAPGPHVLGYRLRRVMDRLRRAGPRPR